MPSPAPKPLSKSKLVAFRQCPRRLWLEVNRPELRVDSAQSKAAFATGYTVGDVARRIYDPEGLGAMVGIADGFEAAFTRSRELLTSRQPIFEAGFAAEGALAFADVLLPHQSGRRRTWRMVEVKASTKVKDYQRDDIAIQAFTTRQAGVPLSGVAIAHVDSDWVYPGGEDYQGLLVEDDCTDEAFGRTDEVRSWIGDAHAIARKRKEPQVATGGHCHDPFDCGFIEHCQKTEPKVEYPVTWLPRVQRKDLKAFLADPSIVDLRQVPDEMLNEAQRRVKQQTLEGETYFDSAGAAADLKPHQLPALFLDFETVSLAVPIWKGTRPYQNIPFQFSVHRLGANGKLTHVPFLDLTGNDPSRPIAEALIAACGEREPIFVYNKSFEQSRIRELAERFPRLKRALINISTRLVDLRPVAEARYYHPQQEGSWSLKAVLPAVIPDLDYSSLDGVQDGGMAMEAYAEAIAPGTTSFRKADIERQLLEYCRLDTYAMVRLWQVFAGRIELRL